MKWRGLIALAALSALPLTAGAKILDSMFDLNPSNVYLTSPITTYWEEIVPSPGNIYHLSSWLDNGDGYLSASDIIDITDAAGQNSFWHVDYVTITIWLTQKTGTGHGPSDLLHSDDPGYMYQTLYNPITTYWEWLPPNFGNFHLSSWDDNGDHYLSASDQIDITENGQVSFWHVDRVAMDIVISPEPSTYAAFATGLVGFFAIRRRRK